MSFSANILKLCAELRANGFAKYASNLEEKFAMLKEAETHLYRAHDEDGEDLVDFAHPDGDVNVADAKDKNGDVETIVSRQKKIIDAISGTPTGKLAEAEELLKMVKLVLAQNASQPSLDELYLKLADNFNKFNRMLDAMIEKSGDSIVKYRNILSMLLGNMIQRVGDIINNKKVYRSDELSSSNTADEFGNSLKIILNEFKGDKEPGFFSMPEEKRVWEDEITPFLDAAYKLADEHKKLADQIRNIEKQNVLSETRKEEQAIENPNKPEKQDAQVTNGAEVISKQDLQSTLTSELSQIKQNLNWLDAHKNNQNANFVKKIEQSLNNYENDLNKFISNINSYDKTQINLNNIGLLTTNCGQFSMISNWDQFKSKTSAYHKKLSDLINYIQEFSNA